MGCAPVCTYVSVSCVYLRFVGYRLLLLVMFKAWTHGVGSANDLGSGQV